ncbi:MAG: TIGR02996 domain-containing protein [Proteobacteria bacterium]|nr:TIGR02996 domain-containing protein [Pseudomonadota bacterium]
MHPDKQNLLRSIQAAPRERVRHMAYADWLIENGEQTRGDFIKNMCQLEALREQPTGRGRYMRRMQADKIRESVRKTLILDTELRQELDTELLHARGVHVPANNYPDLIAYAERFFPRGLTEEAYLDNWNDAGRIDSLSANPSPLRKLISSAEYRQEAEETTLAQVERLKLPALEELDMLWHPNLAHCTHARSMEKVQTLSLTADHLWAPEITHAICDNTRMHPTHINMPNYHQGLDDATLRILIHSDLAKNAIIEISHPTPDLARRLSIEVVRELESHNRDIAASRGEKYRPRPWMRYALPPARRAAIAPNSESEGMGSPG